MKDRTKLYIIYIGCIIFLILTISPSLYYLFYLNTDKYYSRKKSLEEYYGLSYNKEREKRGIPKVHKDWFTYDTSVKRRKSGSIVTEYKNPWNKQLWSDFNENKKIPVHKEKTIYYGDSIREKDIYVNPENESEKYIIELNYMYDNSYNCWECYYQKINNDQQIFKKRIKLNEADRILKKWGLSRFDK